METIFRFRQKIGWIRSKNVIHTPVCPCCPSFMIGTAGTFTSFQARPAAAGTRLGRIRHRSRKFYWNFSDSYKMCVCWRGLSQGRTGVGMDVRVTGRKIQCWLCKCLGLNSKAELSQVSNSKTDFGSLHHKQRVLPMFHNKDTFLKF